MKKIFFFLIAPCLFFLQSQNLEAQDTSALMNLIDADKLASGNYKDVLNSFFQLALQDIAGPDKAIAFTSNIYALRLKSNPDLDIDKNYTKPFTTFCRNMNVNWNLNLDSSYHFNGFAFGAKYAIINRRDYTISKTLIPRVRQMMMGGDSIQQRLTVVVGRISVTDPNRALALNDEVNNFMEDKIKFSELDPELQSAIRPLLDQYYKVSNPDDFRLHEYEKAQYDSIVGTYQNKFLWTIDGNSTTYADQFLFSNVSINSEALKGIVDPNSMVQVELDARTSLDFSDDLLTEGRDLGRSIFSGQGGLNVVFKNHARSQSVAEIKMSATWNDVLNGIVEGEDENYFTLDGTLRFHITKDLWIPLSFSYDPKTGNVLGFLNVTSNFTWLTKYLKNK